jgi:purine-binding chemotaxis protein CheW
MSDMQQQSSNRYLTFSLGKEMFALDIEGVREILDMTDVTRIPQTPKSVRGVVNVRGAAVPVIDLRQRFGMEPSERTVHTRIIIVEIPRSEEVTVLGAIADSVKEVLELEPEAINPPPSMGTAVNVEFLRGIGKHENQFILIVDIAKVLSTDEVFMLGEVSRAVNAQETVQA